MSSNLLGSYTPAEFLDEYWQQKPLLIRQGLAGFESPLTPNELAGLACEPDVHSRLILEEGGEYPWELRKGPFDTDMFLELPETHWSLLVQEVDRLVPAVHDLLERVSFLPRWRIDDIMVSYAPARGSVGAHVDNYDVFLLQGYGHRRWEINSRPLPPEEESLVEGLDVQILSDFDPDNSWVLEPGDVLYLPPRIPHYGVAVDDCMTYSIGFRAPTHREMVLGYLEHLVDVVSDDERYSDQDIEPRAHPGRITSEDLQRVYTVLDRITGDRDATRRWFGESVTRPSRGGSSPLPETKISVDVLTDRIRSGEILRRSEASRFSYLEDASGRMLLFVNGTTYETDPAWARVAELLGDRATFTDHDLASFLEREDCAELLTTLYNEGHLYFP